MNNAQILSAALAPKSDQLNADDLIVENKVIEVTKVLVNLQSEAQKIVVHYANDNGKPWKPSKSMGRVLAELLGGDFANWEGEKIELFRNKEISFGKDKCGGIQIAAMESLRNPVTVLITTKRGVKSKITIQPFRVNDKPAAQQAAPAVTQQPPNEKQDWAKRLIAARNYGSVALEECWAKAPKHIKPEMQEFYDAKLVEAKLIDIKNNPPAAQEEPPLHTEAPDIEQEERLSIGDL